MKKRKEIEQRPSSQTLCLTALMAALVFLTTAAIQIPIPLGYMHLGNVMILVSGACFGPTIGALAGGFGSALADLLTGFPMWALPTLAIKTTMGYAVGRISHSGSAQRPAGPMRVFLGNLAGIGIMVAGYTIFGCILYGSIPAGISQIPGLSLEGILALVIFQALFAASSLTKALRHLRT